MSQLLRSIVWSGARAVNQPWGCTTYTAEPWYAALGCYFHCGIDIAMATGEALYAARAGLVLAVGQGFLAIQVGTEMDWYLHGSRYVVSRGQNVARGQLVGYAGSVAPPGGSSSGPHLHFERQSTLALYCNIPATSRDPVPILESPGGDSSMKVVQGIGSQSIWKTNLVERTWVQDVGELGELLAWCGQSAPEMAHQSTIDRIPIHASQKDVLDAIAALKVQAAAVSDPAVLAAVQQIQATLGDTNAGIADLKAHPAVTGDPAVLALVTKIESALAKSGAALGQA